MIKWSLMIAVCAALLVAWAAPEAEAQGVGADVTIGGLGVTIGGPYYRYRVAPVYPPYYCPPPRAYCPPAVAPARPHTVVEQYGFWPFRRTWVYRRVE
jgi:hypothetical protein